MGTIVLKDLLNDQRFLSKGIARIIDLIWLKEKKKKILITNKRIYIVSERDFASDMGFVKTSRDPKYIAKNCSDQVSFCIIQNTLKM